jgi:hypothetical protein
MSQAFPMRVGVVWRGPLLLIGVTPKRAAVTLDDEALSIQFGLYGARIPLAQIEDVKPIRWSWYHGIGLRISDDALGYVASYKGVVRVGLKQALPFSVLFKLKMDFDGVAFALQDPEGFVQALQAKISA